MPGQKSFMQKFFHDIIPGNLALIYKSTRFTSSAWMWFTIIEPADITSHAGLIYLLALNMCKTQPIVTSLSKLPFIVNLIYALSFASFEGDIIEGRCK